MANNTHTSSPKKSVNWGGRKQDNASQSVNWGGRALNVVVALALLLAMMPIASVASANADPPRAYPALLRMAQERPNDKVRVIVQRKALQHLPDHVLARMGGQIKRDLPLINGVALELPARAVAALARHPGVRWVSLDAPLRSTSAGSYSVLDKFKEKSYSGDDGMQNWNTDWIEVGESGSAAYGLIRAVSGPWCAGGEGNCLRLDPYTPVGVYIYRQADLSGAASATLSVYRNNQLDYNGGYGEEVKLEISADGGASWTTLRAYSSAEFTGTATDTFDIAAYASSNTQIRFLISQQQYGIRYINFDDIEIEYARASEFLAAIGAEQLQSETGLNGQGITVAVVDSGITNHADLQTPADSRVIGSVKFGNHPDTGDAYGHGTHVAGIIAGDGSMSNGEHAGVAPGVNLLNVKVANDQGMSYTSDLVNALQWIYDNKAAYNIQVVNISMNSAVPESYHTNPIDAAVEILWFNGVVVVVSAGNNGNGNGPVTLYPPANDPFVITVGAADDMGTPGLGDDSMAVFSAYGTTEDGFAKPDLVAPGRNLVSLLASTNATVYVEHPAHRVDANYFRMSGTSMSAPVVSGAVALLLQDEPNLTPDQVKYRLKATADKNWPGYGAISLNVNGVLRAGAGYLDAYAAVYGTTAQSANAGIAPSQLLWTGSDPAAWDSVDWNSVDWNSVDWNSVDWNSVDWNSVDWNSATWDD